MITFNAMNHECKCTENEDFVYFAALEGSPFNRLNGFNPG